MSSSTSVRPKRPADFVSWTKLKKRIDIFDVLRHYGWIQFLRERRNGGYSGPCPIHSGSKTDRNASNFTVTESGRGWRCFGRCKDGGSIIDLVARKEEVTNSEAGELLATWFPVRDENHDEGDETPEDQARPIKAEMPRTLAITRKQSEVARDSDYRQHVFSGVPVYATRLERLTELDVGDFEQCETPELLARLLRSYFEDRDREEFVVVLFNAGMRVLGLVQVSVGGQSRTIVEPAQVFKAAILTGAHAIALAHNHPSGSQDPSADDVEITGELFQCGKLLGIEIFDHLIIAGRQYVSLAQRGLLPESS